MTFDEVLARVLDLLQRQGRVSYRALKRRFDLDDDYLEDLKAEIIKAQQLARDDAGEVLVWTGDTAPAAVPVSPPTPDPVRAPLTYTPPYLAEKIFTSRAALEGERKQVTVLFADLKGSTELIEGLDPEEARRLLDPALHVMAVFRMGQELGVGCRVHAAATLWLLGYPAQALARLHEALKLAHELSHPYSLAFAQCWAALVYQVRRDVPAVHEQAVAAVALSTEQGFPLWLAMGTSLHGWALALQGQGEAGRAQVRQGLAAWRATGAALRVPYLCTVLAEVAAHLGHPEDGLRALAEAHTLVEQHEERRWEAEISRLRGALLLRQPGTSQAEAETWLQRALDVARCQEAKSLELRAAMSLARLWQQQGKPDEARQLLAPIYGWFTEGFDTADLREAKGLLDALS